MVAGLGLFFVFVGQHRAVGRARDPDLAVLAVQIGLEGVLDAVLADHGVGGVFEQRVFLVLLLRHQTRVAQDVRGVVGLIVAGEGALDLDAGELGLHDGGDQLHAGVLDEDVVGGVDGVADVDGVAEARDLAHVLGGVVAVDVVARTHIAQQLHRGRVRGQALRLVLEIGLQHRALDLGHVRVVFKGRLLRDRQVVDIGVAEFLDHVDELEQDAVRVVAREELARVDRQVVAFLVADQDAAVAVEDVAARGGDGLFLVLQLAAGGVILFAFDDRNVIEKDEVDHQQDDQQDSHGQDALLGDGFVHRLFLSVIRSTGRAGSRRARRRAATTASAGSRSLSRRRSRRS